MLRNNSIEQNRLVRPGYGLTALSRGEPSIDQILNRTEREGFEPSKDVNTLNRLAICRFRPLSHLSKMTVTNYSTHILFLPTPNLKIPQSLTLYSIRDLNRPPLPQSP